MGDSKQQYGELSKSNPSIYGLRKKIAGNKEKQMFTVWENDEDISNANIDRNDVLAKFLYKDDSKKNLVLGTPKVLQAIHKEDFTEDFHLSEEELNSYCEGFAEAIIENIKDTYDKIISLGVNEADLAESALDDSDVKLSLYRSFKSLYDKWICRSSDSADRNPSVGYFFNRYGQRDERTLFEHFNFINRTNADIGGKAVIDVSYLSNLSNTSQGQGPTQSLYNSITGLLSKNNFDFFPMPNFVNYSNTKKGTDDLLDMWRPLSETFSSVSAQPSFICMFIGGSSRTLDIPRSFCGDNGLQFQYKDDSFDINDPSSYPADFIESTGGITAFKIRYGQEAQNHFKSLTLDQAEFKETQESLMVIDALTNPKTGNSPSQVGKGNNLFDTYLTRSYSCDVEAFGNQQIQPLMFFKLENVPMYRGTYMIVDVKHEITAHNSKTTFKGVRQPIVQVPLVTDALSLLDIALTPDEAFEGQLGDLSAGLSTSSTWAADGEVIDLNLASPDTTPVLGSNADQKCPADPDIEDGGVGDAYIKGKRYEIRLCKVKDTKGNKGLVNVEVALNLANMMRKAKKDGVDLTIGSSFRTMATQTKIAHANGCYKTGKFVYSTCDVATATPGRSNHQSGTAIDFGCGGKTICYSNSSAWCAKNGATSRPKQYPCFKWMVDNAHDFGYYNFKKEAWHWSRTGG